MTTFLTPGGAGIGGKAAPTTDTRALQDINSQQKTFANKDFVKNIAWLNNSVDTLSQWSQKLQSGVDQANQNAIEQIQGIFADIFVVFGGLEPTGIEMGDLKYIFQALGALLGINPDTPFPFNLVEGVTHLFNTYIMPLPQLTDIVLDTVEAWAEELGFTDEAVDSIEEFSNAIVTTYNDWNDVSLGMQQGLMDLFRELGLGQNFLSLNWFGDVFGELGTLIANFTAQPRQMLLSALSTITVLLFKGLTGLVRLVDPYTIITSLGLDSLGPQLAIPVSQDPQDWFLDTDPDYGWVFDGAHSHGGSAGSFHTSGNGANKTLMPQDRSPCGPDDILIFSGFVAWNDVPEDVNLFGLQVGWYNDAAPVSTYNINVPAGHGTAGGWAQIGERLSVPPGVNGYRLGVRISHEVDSGDVWVDDLSVTKQSSMGVSIYNVISMFLPSHIWQNFLNGVMQIEGATWEMVATFIRSIEGIGTFVTKLLGGGATVEDLSAFVRSLFGPFNPPSLIGTGQVGAYLQNLILNPTFKTAESLLGESIWVWDTLRHSLEGGSAMVDAAIDGTVKSLLSNPIMVALNDTLQASVWTMWEDLVYTVPPVSMMLNLYNEADELIDELVLQTADDIGEATDWVNLNSSYVIDNAEIAYARLRFNVDAAATAGRVWFDDVALTKPNLIAKSFVQDLETNLTNMADDISRTWTQFVNRFAPGLPTDAASLYLSYQQAVSNANSLLVTAASQIENAVSLLNIRNIIPIHFGVGSTQEVSIPVAHLGTGVTPNNFNVTAAGGACIGFVRIGAAALKKVIVWHGAGKTNITEFYIAVYKVNQNDGSLDRIHLSDNIISSVSAGWNWNVYNVPNGLPALAGEVYAIELRVVGSGTHTIGGATLQWMPDYPGYPKKFGAKRTGGTAAPASIDAATVDGMYSNDVPFFSIGMDADDVPSTDVDPIEQQFSSPGDYYVNIQPWAVLIDCIGLGAGGAGGSGNNYGIPVWISGDNGGNGVWNADTLVRGEDIPWDTTQLHVHVGYGAGATPGGGYNGANGEATYFEASGYVGLNCPGGGGGGAFGGVNTANWSRGAVGDLEYPASSGRMYYSNGFGGYSGGAGSYNGMFGAAGSWGSGYGAGGGGGNTGGSWPVAGAYGAGGTSGFAAVRQRQQ